MSEVKIIKELVIRLLEENMSKTEDFSERKNKEIFLLSEINRVKFWFICDSQNQYRICLYSKKRYFFTNRKVKKISNEIAKIVRENSRAKYPEVFTWYGEVPEGSD